MICAGNSVYIEFYLFLFIGIAIGGLCIAPLSDIWGRKLFLLLGLLGLFAVYIGIMVADSYTKMHWCMLAYGICLAVVLITGLLLMLQNMPKEGWPFILLATLIWIASLSVGVDVYLMFLSKNWNVLFYIVFAGLCLVILFIYFFISESLRYLYDSEQYEELNSSLALIHKKNNQEGGNPVLARSYVKNWQRLRRKKEGNSYQQIKEDSDSFLNLVCLVVVFICVIFSTQTLVTLLIRTKLDLYGIVSLIAVADILGYILGFILFKALDLKDGLYYSFLFTIFTLVIICIYKYSFSGDNLAFVVSFMILCKIFISSALFLAFLGLFLTFKARVQGTAFGLCLALAYVIALFEPLISNQNPAWFSLAFIALFSFFSAFIAHTLVYEKQDLTDPLIDKDFEDFENGVLDIVEELTESEDDDSDSDDGK